MPQNICFVKSNCPVLIDVLPCNVTTSWSSISKICLFDCSEWPSVFLPDLIHAPHTVQHDHTKSTAPDVAVLKFGQLYLSWISGCIANHSQYFCNYRMFYWCLCMPCSCYLSGLWTHVKPSQKLAWRISRGRGWCEKASRDRFFPQLWAHQLTLSCWTIILLLFGLSGRKEKRPAATM